MGPNWCQLCQIVTSFTVCVSCVKFVTCVNNVTCWSGHMTSNTCVNNNSVMCRSCHVSSITCVNIIRCVKCYVIIATYGNSVTWQVPSVSSVMWYPKIPTLNQQYSTHTYKLQTPYPSSHNTASNQPLSPTPRAMPYIMAANRSSIYTGIWECMFSYKNIFWHSFSLLNISVICSEISIVAYSLNSR